VSSRLEDLRDLARMLDEGKISRGEYDIVKTELIQAPAEEWEPPADVAPQGVDAEEIPDEEPAAGWRGVVGQIPTIYRVAAAGGVLVMVTRSSSRAVATPPALLRQAERRLRRPRRVRRRSHWVFVSTTWPTVGTT
jgi:hypothetical protein